jgi:hypothetical protein
MIRVRTLDGEYELSPEEERAFRRGLWGVSNEPCGHPLPSPNGIGTCLRCGWQHARRGPGALEHPRR